MNDILDECFAPRPKKKITLAITTFTVVLAAHIHGLFINTGWLLALNITSILASFVLIARELYLHYRTDKLKRHIPYYERNNCGETHKDGMIIFDGIPPEARPSPERLCGPECKCNETK